MLIKIDMIRMLQRVLEKKYRFKQCTFAFMGFLLFWFTYVGANFSENISLFPLIHNYSDYILEAHIAIGNNFPQYWDFWEITSTIKALERYNTVQVSSYWWLTNEGYASSYALLQKSRDMQSFLSQKLNKFKNQELACWEKKKFFDRGFFTAFSVLRAGAMQQAMSSAIEMEQCATYARVYYNWYKKLYDRLAQQYELFAERFEYWTQRRSILMRK